MSIEFQRDVDLTSLTTFQTVARAEYFYEAISVPAVREALAKAKEMGLDVSILGGGANTIACGKIPGLVLKVGVRQYEFESDLVHGATLRLGAGEILDKVVSHTIALGWGGLENLAAIPGTVGGAVVQNVGAYGVELAERFVSVDVLNRETGVVSTLGINECDFGYRDSVFKHARKDDVIVGVTLRLPRPWTPVTEYKGLAAALEGETVLTPAIVERAVRSLRARKLPDPVLLGNAGSFFKNPVVSKVHWREILKEYPSVVSYPLGGARIKLAAAWLIEAAGFKGASRGPVGVFDRHALILVNHGRASGDDVMALATDIQDAVQRQFGVKLEMEPALLGVVQKA